MNSWIPKIYLLNSTEYPKYEHPLGSGRFHEYPHYLIAGRRVPTQYVALGCLASVTALVMLLTSGSKTKVSHPTKAVEFPEPKRDFAAEKEEFIHNYMAAAGVSSSESHSKH